MRRSRIRRPEECTVTMKCPTGENKIEGRVNPCGVSERTTLHAHRGSRRRPLLVWLCCRLGGPRARRIAACCLALWTIATASAAAKAESDADKSGGRKPVAASESPKPAKGNADTAKPAAD